MSCGVGRRCGSDPKLLWLWCRLAAEAQIQPENLGTSICQVDGPNKKKKKIEHLGDVPGQVRAPLPSPSCSVVESGLSHPPQAPGMLGICLLKGGWPTLTGQ